MSGYGRPNQIGNPNSACPTASAGTENCFFNPAAVAIPSFSFGNLGKDVLRNEPFYNMDFSLVKNVPLGESRSIKLRFEAFNVFNLQILGTPGTTIGLATAGVISTIASTPRQLQIGAKISF